MYQIKFKSPKLNDDEIQEYRDLFNYDCFEFTVIEHEKYTELILKSLY